MERGARFLSTIPSADDSIARRVIAAPPILSEGRSPVNNSTFGGSDDKKGVHSSRRGDLNLTYLFISHDLGVVEHLSDRVVIMYLGRIVEVAPTEVLFRQPNHPYTDALLSEVPKIETRHRRYTPIRGEIPSPIDPPSGCHFHPRCPKAGPRCAAEVPALAEFAPGRFSACHLNDPRGVAL